MHATYLQCLQSSSLSTVSYASFSFELTLRFGAKLIINMVVNYVVPPATSITLSGSRPGPLYWGTSLTLTCIVNYDTPLVDTPVSFCINITGPQTNSVTTNTTANVSIATFNPLLPVHDGSYVCSFSISPSSESLFVLPSMSASSSLLDLVLTGMSINSIVPLYYS